MHRYLSEVYSALVKPCVAKLKQIMLEFNFSSEAEIFSSDLRFKMFDNTSDNRYKCNMPLKTEDSMSRLKSKLGRITERYTAKFNEIVETHEKGHGKWGLPDHDARRNIAVATYLATYFDVNQATKDYYALNQDDKTFNDFLIDEVMEGNEEFDQVYHEKMKNYYETYKVNCKKIVNGDTRKQMKMLQCRKLLSVPWLVCPDALIGNLPNNF